MEFIRTGLTERARLALIVEPRLRLGSRPIAAAALPVPTVLAMFPDLPVAPGV